MRHLGLIIGVNQYQDSAFCPLSFAENDARALAQWLVNAKGGQWSPPDVQLAQGQHVTRELIESLLTQVCITDAEPDDIVLIYYAGHGFVDEQSGEGYLALVNTRYQEASSGLSLRKLTQQFMMRSRAAQVLCILDCFQSGQIWQMRRTSPYDSKPLLGQNIMNLLQQQQNRLFLCSCRGNATVPESGERQLGTFAHSLILGLCGPARESATGNITLPKLHAYLFKQLGEQHRPQLFGQQNPPLVLVGDPSKTALKQAAMAAPAATPRMSPTSAGGPPQGSGLLRMQQAGVFTQAPPASPDPVTSGHLPATMLEDQRRQQCRQLVAQAQQLVQNQNYGPAFDLAEQALLLVPDDTEALTVKAQLLGTAGRFPEALAIIEQILQREPANALIWSMRAVVLGNMGQYQQALMAIERSLELDAQNPETYSIKTTIMANLAAEQAQAQPGNGLFNQFTPRSFAAQDPVRENPRSFYIGAGLQVLGLLCGGIGCGLLFAPVPLANIAQIVGLLLASFSVALLSINALRGTFRYGFGRFVLVLLTTLLLAGILGAAYKLAYTRIVNMVVSNPGGRLIPVLFTAGWLAASAIIPLLLAIFGLLGWLIARARKRE